MTAIFGWKSFDGLEAGEDGLLVALASGTTESLLLTAPHKVVKTFAEREDEIDLTLQHFERFD